MKKTFILIIRIITYILSNYYQSVQYIFLIGCAAIIALTRQWYAISLIILWYVIFSIITQRKRPAHD